MNVTLNSITPNAEATMAYIARVSSPANQDSKDYAKLLRYCIDHQHWSVFEHAHMTLEIETSLAIATQILRHRSFTFQQFSQRYSDASNLNFEPIEWRKQAKKNRQSSLDPVDPEIERVLQECWENIQEQTTNLYNLAIETGVARECARFVLPQATTTRLYMTGNIRSWIHYLQLRTQPDTQVEHRQVAHAARAIFCKQLPVIAEALAWNA